MIRKRQNPSSESFIPSKTCKRTLLVEAIPCHWSSAEQRDRCDLQAMFTRTLDFRTWRPGQSASGISTVTPFPRLGSSTSADLHSRQLANSNRYASQTLKPSTSYRRFEGAMENQAQKCKASGSVGVPLELDAVTSSRRGHFFLPLQAVHDG